MIFNSKYLWSFFILFLAGFSSLSFAQQIQVQGKITDSLQNPLPYANILAIPNVEDLEVKFGKNNTGLNVNINLINHKLNLQNQTKKKLKLNNCLPNNYEKTVIEKI